MRLGLVFSIALCFLAASACCTLSGRQRRACQSEVGCKPAYSPPACAEGMQVLTVDELLKNRDKHLGRVVSVRANLREQGRNCTQLNCPDVPDCCNTCGSGLVLSDRSAVDFPPRVPGDSGVLRLEKTDWKSPGPHFRCHGDRSKMCCTISGVDTPITATGTVSDKYGLVLENPVLCH